MAKIEITAERLAQWEKDSARLTKVDATALKARLRRDARIKLTLTKAKDAEISVSDKEVDAYVKKHQE